MNRITKVLIVLAPVSPASYLRLRTAGLAHIGVIVCSADTEPDGMLRLFVREKAITMANEVADLPEFIAQRDGRKMEDDSVRHYRRESCLLRTGILAG
jgi:hypothetical protein